MIPHSRPRWLKTSAKLHATTMQTRLREVDVPGDLITIRGGGHGMQGWDKLGSDFRTQITKWLVSHLAAPAGR
jgi:hypothetical protein